MGTLTGSIRRLSTVDMFDIFSDCVHGCFRAHFFHMHAPPPPLPSLSPADVVTIDKTGENFRLLFDVKGRFTVHRISNEEAKVGPLA